MAKRKSINMSRYSHRTSAGSGFLDPNSQVVGEEEPFWWNNLTNNVNSHLAKYDATNETSKYLDSDSQMQSTNTDHEWWKMLNSSDSTILNDLPIVQNKERSVSLELEEMNTVDMDDYDDLPLQKRKITMRNKSKRSKSNAFLKALNDSKNSVSPESVKKNSITKPTNNASTSNQSLQKLHSIHTNISRESNDSIPSSIDQSHTIDKILKSKPNVFRKKYKEKSDNAFENLLKSNEDIHNKTERTETISRSSFAKLIEKNHTSKESVFDTSREENKSKMSSSRTVPFKKSIIDPIHDNNLIYHNRTDSSFNLSNNSNENDDLEIQPNHTNVLSHKNVSENISINQKESSVVEKNANLIMYPSTSFKKTNESTTNNKEIENRETINKGETSLANIRHVHTPNKNGMEHSKNFSINNSNVRKTIYASEHDESMNERNLITRSNNENNISQTLSTNISSKISMNLSNSKPRKTNNLGKKKISFIISSEPNNINNSMYDRNSIDHDSINITKIGISSGNQIHTINSSNKSVHIANVITDASENRTLKTKTFTSENTSIHDIPELNEKNVLKDNDKIQTKDLDMNALSLNKKALRTIDVVTNDNEQNDNEHYVDQHNHKILNSINTDQKKKISDYFMVTNSKFVSPTKAIQSKHFQLSNTKEEEEIKARLNKKQKTNINKAVNVHLTKAKDTQLKKKQIIEKIKNLRQEKKQKYSAKDKINEAYIVNGQVYKRPKLPRPKYWATDRLYHFLWKIMEPKSKLLTRVHSEKFMEELSDIVSSIVKSKKYEDYVTILNKLMKKMAKLGIIRTRNDFYNFCYDFLPYDFRVKVVPMLLPGKGRNIPYDPETLHKSLLEE